MYGLTYGYNTSLSPLMVNHMRKKYKFLKINYKLLKGQILDIGSNDGTFKSFRKFKRSKTLWNGSIIKKFLNNYKKYKCHYGFSKKKLLANISSEDAKKKLISLLLTLCFMT